MKKQFVYEFSLHKDGRQKRKEKKGEKIRIEYLRTISTIVCPTKRESSPSTALLIKSGAISPPKFGGPSNRFWNTKFVSK